MNKFIWVALVIVALISVGSYFAHVSKSGITFGSPSGTNFYGQSGSNVGTIYSPSSSAASSTSILNSSGNTWVVENNVVDCNGVNGRGATFTAATTTVPNEGLQGNTNYIMNDVATTTTTSLSMFVSSTTEGVITYDSRLWPSGTYMTFVASAYTTASCFVGFEVQSL